jgi:hypothetical protein
MLDGSRKGKQVAKFIWHRECDKAIATSDFRGRDEDQRDDFIDERPGLCRLANSAAIAREPAAQAAPSRSSV